MNSDVCRSVSTSVVFPAPEGAESTKRIPLRVNRLLKVLNLLANFFQFGLASDDPLRDGGVIRLRAQSVQFAKDLLGNKFEGPPDRFVPAEMMRELRQMTLDARQFFRNVGAIGKKRDFLYQPFVVRGDWQPGFLNALEQGNPILFDNVGMHSAD